MNTYKIGNAVNCIIRNYMSEQINNYNFSFTQEPYTILYGQEVSLTFEQKNVSARSANALMAAWANERLTSVRISNVKLTDKILDLIFEPFEPCFSSKAEHYQSDEQGKLYLNMSDSWQQVYVYDINGELEAHYDTLNDSTLTVALTDSDYLLVYAVSSNRGYALNRNNNICLTLDLDIVGNEENDTHSMSIHIDKCILQVDRNMYFNSRANAVDLILNVIGENNDFLVIA